MAQVSMPTNSASAAQLGWTIEATKILIKYFAPKSVVDVILARRDIGRITEEKKIDFRKDL